MVLSLALLFLGHFVPEYYGKPVVQKAVPLALELLSASNPQLI